MPIFEFQTPDGKTIELDAPDQGAAIDAFSSIGKQVQTQQPQGWGDTAIDVAKSLGSGALSGASSLIGIPGTISDAFNSNLSAALGIENNIPPSVLGGQSINNGVSAATGGANQYQPQTTPGEYARTAGEFIPGAVAFGGVNPANIAKFGLLPGLASEAAGQATEGTSYEPYARIGAAVVAPLAAGGVASALGGGVSAERAIAQAAQRDAITPDVARQALAASPQATIADLGSNLTGQASALANNPGVAQSLIRSTLENRAAGAGPRIASATDEALGGAKNLTKLADDIKIQQSEKAAPLYEAAYAKPVTVTDDLSSILKRPAVSEAMKRAQKTAANEGIEVNPNVPNMRVLDLAKRELDDMIGAAKRAGENNQARVLTNTKNELLGIMDNTSPEYAQARQAWAGDQAFSDALKEGQEIFKKSVNPDQFAKEIAKLSPSELQAYQMGARQEIQNIMGTARNDSLAARSALEKGYNQEKLKILLGEEAANKLISSISNEGKYASTANTITGNSATAARQQAQADLGLRSTGGLSARDAFTAGGFSGLARDAALRGVDTLTGGLRSARQASRNEELAKLLMSNDPAILQNALALGNVPSSYNNVARALIAQNQAQQGQSR